MIASLCNRISCYEMPEDEGLDGLRAKMLRELELDLSYALRRGGEARRAWGMRHVPGLAKVNGSGNFRFYPSP